MLSEHGRKPASVVIEPVAGFFHRLGLSANTVTIAGTILSAVFALWLIPAGHHFAAAVLIGITVAFDMVDGTMARMNGGGTKFGATLDATCDRLTDGAIFGALAYWLAIQEPEQHALLIVTLVILVAGQVTSYVKARAEASGIKVIGGLIERPERLIISLVALGIADLGVPYILAIGLWLLVVGSVYTVVQRLWMVARSEKATDKIAAPAGAREFATNTAADPAPRGSQRGRP